MGFYFLYLLQVVLHISLWEQPQHPPLFLSLITDFIAKNNINDIIDITIKFCK